MTAPRLVNFLEQGREGIVIFARRRQRARRKRTAKCGGDAGLIGQIIYLDDSTVHRMIACGVLFDFY